MKGIAHYIEGMADGLVASGYSLDEEWRRVLHAVPRHVFAPSAAWVGRWDGPARLVRRDVDEEAWLRAVYSDVSIVTQFDDGAGALEAGGEDFTSSLSAPGVVVAFLDLLGVRDHQRVLEVGTGTGWTAGLLAWRLGDESVTSVEIDAGVVREARANLRDAGLGPGVVEGDGADGWEAGAPYDRVHVTCGVREVPYAWIRQTRPGGRVVFPWMPGFAFGHRAWLTVTGDGRGIGRFAGNAGYMMLRSQRFGDYAPAVEEDAEPGETRVDPRAVAGESYGCDVAVAGLVPGVTSVEEETGGGCVRLHLRDPDGAWALVDFEPGRDVFPVFQAGPRRLWTEVEAAYLRWLAWGSPSRDRFGMTVTPTGQHLWLDSPDNPITP